MKKLVKSSPILCVETELGTSTGDAGETKYCDYIAMGVLEKICELTLQRAEIPQTLIGESLLQRLLEVVKNHLGESW